MSSIDTVSFLNGEIPVVEADQADGKMPKVREFTKLAATAEENGSTIFTDVIVVGAGFSGITAIDRFRKAGMDVKCFESGEHFGGVWYWNRYPGARVDSEAPFYQLNIPEVYRTWTWTERFPGQAELQKYVAHVDHTLHLRKDTYFNSRVIDASWDENTNKWTIQTAQGHTACAKYLILCTGLLHRTYTPDFPGLKTYQGKLYHSGTLDKDFDARGKKIGVIGAGATAVQITQELGKVADELVVFIRRPSYCLSMKQRKMTKEEQSQMKSFYPALFAAGRNSATGFPIPRIDQDTEDVPPEEREAHWNYCWEQGGFNFSFGGYKNTLLNPDANQLKYNFWRKKVCERLTDPQKQKIMAPEKMPFYFGTKRSPLEQDYYEVLNQTNVRIHNLSASPLKSFASEGLVMADDKEYNFDAVILATGFDSFTGSLTTLGLKNRHGVGLAKLWAGGLSTYLGLTISGFPNMFMTYSPQAPAPISNGTTLIEAQVETIVDMVRKMEIEGVRYVDPTKEAEAEWSELLDGMIKHTLFPFTDSWWNGSNVPGKKAQNLTYIGGLNMYEKHCRATMDGWRGFDVAR